MELRIKNHLRKSLADDEAMQKAYGMMSKKIKRVLDALQSVDTLDEVKKRFSTFEELTGDRSKTFSIRLTGNWRLILEPDWDSVDSEKFLKDDGGIDYSMVSNVLIVEIIDYH